jgi:hypothetical protein
VSRFCQPGSIVGYAIVAASPIFKVVPASHGFSRRSISEV